jgi:hypothetical protein
LSACAVTLVGENRLSQLGDAVAAVAEHPEAMVREAAAAALRRLGTSRDTGRR